MNSKWSVSTAGIMVAAILAAHSTLLAEDALAQTQEVKVVFRPSGKLVEEREYLRDKQKVGSRLFYANGVVAEEELYKGGKLNGPQRQFYESGKLLAERPYTDGRLDGVVRYYKENGELLGESKIQNGTGVLRQFALQSLGLTDQEIPYKDGVIDGTSAANGDDSTALRGLGAWSTNTSRENWKAGPLFFTKIESSWSQPISMKTNCTAYSVNFRMMGLRKKAIQNITSIIRR